MSKKKAHHEEHVDETWLIPYADMLTLLLALFIVMFAGSQVDSKKFKEISREFNTIFSGGDGVMDKEGNIMNPQDLQPDGSGDGDAEKAAAQKAEKAAKMETEDQNLKEIKKQLDETIGKEGFKDKIKTILSKEALEISIQERILFDSGDAIIHSEVNPILAMIAKILSGIPNSIRIVGHTDSIPIFTDKFTSNWDLSVIRAVNTMKYIISKEAIQQNRFTVSGNGEFMPIGDNSNEEGRQKNRRVEIFILRMHPLTEDKSKETNR